MHVIVAIRVDLKFLVIVVSEDSLLKMITVVKKFQDTVQLDGASLIDRVANEIVLCMSQLQCSQPEISC